MTLLLPLQFDTVSEMTTDMASEASSADGGLFQREANEVLTGLRIAFNGVTAELGVRRPVDLQKLLKLDPTLSWQIVKVAGDANVLTTGSAVPSRVSVDKFVTGAGRLGVAADKLEAVTAAYAEFERLVEKHAGDRTSFNSLITAAGGLAEEWLATDLQHRRNMFRGLSHTMGVQAQTRFLFCLVARRTDQDGYDMAALSGYVGLRVLRPLDRVRVHGLRIANVTDPDAVRQASREPLGLGEGANGYLADEFCSQPLPHLLAESGDQGSAKWIRTSLIRPEMGNVGMSNLFFGEKIRMANLFAMLEHRVTVPAEVVVQDVLLEPGLIQQPPRLRVFLGDDDVTKSEPDMTPLVHSQKVEYLGKGPSVLATAEIPRYADAVRAAAGKVGHDVEKFDAWRVRIEFPVYRSTSRIYVYDPRPDANDEPGNRTV